MIEHLSGTLERKSPDAAVIDIRGVGFKVQIPLSTYDVLPEAGDTVTLHTFLNLREDGLTLYGFATPGEREVFHLLTGVSQVGPGLALSLLSQLSVEQVRRAIDTEDVTLLATAKGVGKKMAQRIVFELRGKLPPATVDGEQYPHMAESPAFSDALDALVSLGYRRAEAKRALLVVLSREPDASVAEIMVREALREL